jgi:hypothetical protein
VGKDGTRAAGQHCSQPLAPPTDLRVPNRKYASVDGNQSPVRKASLDQLPGTSQLQQLPTRDDSMLAFREFAYRINFGGYVPLKLMRDLGCWWHRRSFSPRPAPVARRTSRHSALSRAMTPSRPSPPPRGPRPGSCGGRGPGA